MRSKSRHLLTYLLTYANTRPLAGRYFFIAVGLCSGHVDSLDRSIKQEPANTVLRLFPGVGSISIQTGRLYPTTPSSTAKCIVYTVYVSRRGKKRLTTIGRYFYSAMLLRMRYCHGKSSVCPSVRNVEVQRLHKLEFFENNFTADYPNFSSLCSADPNITDLFQREHPKF